jgi:hypothetical protein
MSDGSPAAAVVLPGALIVARDSAESPIERMWAMARARCALGHFRDSAGSSAIGCRRGSSDNASSAMLATITSSATSLEILTINLELWNAISFLGSNAIRRCRRV